MMTDHPRCCPIAKKNFACEGPLFCRLQHRDEERSFLNKISISGRVTASHPSFPDAADMHCGCQAVYTVHILLSHSKVTFLR